ncbi:MAG: class I SAM-dependent methyltransferase [Bacillota bacterium]
MVTTTLRGGPGVGVEALECAAELGAVYVPREGYCIEDLITAYGVQGVLAVGTKRVSLFYVQSGAGRLRTPFPKGEEESGAESDGGAEINSGVTVLKEFYFHPGTAKLRIKNVLYGKPDQMVQAMGLRPGDSVLDCTLGLGADAYVAGFVTGPDGRVLGLEKSAVLAAVVGHGLRRWFLEPEPLLQATMRRIEVKAADHLDYLSKAPAGGFDVVYFDPFFGTPVKGAFQVVPLRAIGETSPLTSEAVKEAVRVARRRVVMKERRGGGECARLGFERVVGGRYARVAYGVIEK